MCQNATNQLSWFFNLQTSVIDHYSYQCLENTAYNIKEGKKLKRMKANLMPELNIYLIFNMNDDTTINLTQALFHKRNTPNVNIYDKVLHDL